MWLVLFSPAPIYSGHLCNKCDVPQPRLHRPAARATGCLPRGKTFTPAPPRLTHQAQGWHLPDPAAGHGKAAAGRAPGAPGPRLGLSARLPWVRVQRLPRRCPGPGSLAVCKGLLPPRAAPYPLAPPPPPQPRRSDPAGEVRRPRGAGHAPPAPPRAPPRPADTPSALPPETSGAGGTAGGGAEAPGTYLGSAPSQAPETRAAQATADRAWSRSPDPGASDGGGKARPPGGPSALCCPGQAAGFDDRPPEGPSHPSVCEIRKSSKNI